MLANSLKDTECSFREAFILESDEFPAAYLNKFELKWE